MRTLGWSEGAKGSGDSVTAPDVPTSPDPASPPSGPVPVRPLPPSPFRPLAPSLLPYAGVAAQYGVVVERSPDGGVTILVPPWPWYRRPAVFYGIAILFAVQTAPAILTGVMNGIWAPLIGLGVIGVVIAAVWVAVDYIRKRTPPLKAENYATKFEVNRDTLNVWWRTPGESRPAKRVGPQPPDMEHFSCHRDEIVSIRGDLFRMGLTIRVRRRFIAELLHERPKVLRVWIARTLCEALRIPDGSEQRES